MIPPNVVPQLIEVEEELIKNAAEVAGGEDNSFSRLLIYGEVYRKAGLTPIYLTTKDFTDFAVSCEETFQKKLH